MTKTPEVAPTPPGQTDPVAPPRLYAQALEGLIWGNLRLAQSASVLGLILLVAGVGVVWSEWAESQGLISALWQDVIEFLLLLLMIGPAFYAGRHFLATRILRAMLIAAFVLFVINHLFDVAEEVAALASNPILGDDSPWSDPLGKLFAMASLWLFFSTVYIIVVALDGALIRLDNEATVLKEEIRQRKEAEMALRESEQRYRTLFETTKSPILIFDPNGRYIDCNAAATEFLECTKEELMGRSLHDHLPRTAPDQSAPGALTTWGDETTAETECTVKGQAKYLDLTLTPGKMGGETVIFAVGKDITERKLVEAELRRLATTDSLTNAYNRRYFLTAGEAEFSRMLRYGRPLSLLMLDADHFKRINDTFGHAAGDTALLAIADVCRTALRTNDTLGRLGGEEFGAILPETTESEALQVAERLREALADREIRTGEHRFHLTVSIGLATASPDDADFEGLLRKADSALYLAKDAGRNRVSSG